MRFRQGRLLALALLLSVLAGPMSSPGAINGKMCADPQDIIGFGTSTQFRAQYEMFIPAFEARCKSAAGLVSYFAGDDAAMFQRILNRGVDYDNPDLFWARDSALNHAELAQVMGDTNRRKGGYSPVGHFPTFVLGIAVAYNPNCIKKPLNLSALNLSFIYAGTILRWNDQRLLKDNPDNPGLATCDKAIKLTGRADPSGETLTFKSYLARRNPAWAPYAQQQLNTQWPSPLVCRGGGDAGAAGCVASNTGSIGFTGITRAKRMRLKVANVERIHIDRANPAKSSVDFVAPSAAGCTQAAQSVDLPPGFHTYGDWNAIQLVDASDGYPICYFSYLMTFQKLVGAYDQKLSESGARTLRDYMRTIFSEKVQRQIAAKGYGRVPAKFLALNREGVELMEHPDCTSEPVILPEQVDPKDRCFGIVIGGEG